MKILKVYYFYVYDVETDKKIKSQRPATKEAIARINGIPIEESSQEVLPGELDGNGFLMTKA